MYYHASAAGAIKKLAPRISDHGVPLVYFSKKRENVLVYLSNAVEKYCRETGFFHDGTWKKWGPYGFDENGMQRLEEYYPDALKKTYQGVSGYIYCAAHIEEAAVDIGIPAAAVSSAPVDVVAAEFVPDAYEAILKAEKEGLLTIMRYEDMPETMRAWRRRTVAEEYENAADHPEYRHFLKGNFPDVLPG